MISKSVSYGIFLQNVNQTYLKFRYFIENSILQLQYIIAQLVYSCKKLYMFFIWYLKKYIIFPNKNHKNELYFQILLYELNKIFIKATLFLLNYAFSLHKKQPSFFCRSAAEKRGLSFFYNA